MWLFLRLKKKTLTNKSEMKCAERADNTHKSLSGALLN